jgi:serine/tyrosine/threonine adenylyltransferase
MSSGCAVHLTSAPASSDGRWPVKGYEIPTEEGGSSSSQSASVGSLPFDNRQLRDLPLDTEKENYVRSVRNACFSLVQPTPVKNPVVVSLSLPALGLLGINRDEIAAKLASGEFADYFSGNKVLPGAEPAAHCYCGHQFGAFSGQLGDGATMHLGEIVAASSSTSPSSSKPLRWELQFKGAGKTPYSRTADGRKVLRSSLREFLCSELMASLRIPTTRAGTCVTSDTKVVRDVFYQGNPINERATIITRIAPTFLRFGSFEIAKPRDSMTGRTGPSVGRLDIIEDLARYCLLHFYGDLVKEALGAGVTTAAAGTTVPPGDVDKSLEDAFDRLSTTPEGKEQKASLYLQMWTEVCKGNARLVAHWQALGWCHGVLNTDNNSILPWPRPGSPGYPPMTSSDPFVFGGSGALNGNVTLGWQQPSGTAASVNDEPIYATGTIDYGPYGWMERFNPGFICNASDDSGRYSYESQPHVMRWNVLKLGEQLAFLFPKAMQEVTAATTAVSSMQEDGDDESGASASGSASDAGAGSGSSSGVPRWKRLLPQCYDRPFQDTYRALIARKLGLGWTVDGSSSSAEDAGATKKGGKGVEDDASEEAWEERVDDLIGGLLGVMTSSGCDYTNAFRALMAVPVATPAASLGSEGTASENEEAFLKQIFLTGIKPQLSTVEELSKSFEPRIPPAQLGMLLMLAEKDPRFADHIEGLQEEMQRHEQYKKMKGMSEEAKAKDDEAAWTAWLKKYREELRKEAERFVKTSSSSTTATTTDAFERFKESRMATMARSNPVFVLRNWIAQEAIQAAEAGDFTVVQEVLKRMLDPYCLKKGTTTATATTMEEKEEDEAMTKVCKSGMETSDSVARASERAAAQAAKASCVAAAAAAGAGVSGQPTQPELAAVPPFLGQNIMPPDQYACKAPSWASNLRVT